MLATSQTANQTQTWNLPYARHVRSMKQSIHLMYNLCNICMYRIDVYIISEHTYIDTYCMYVMHSVIYYSLNNIHFSFRSVNLFYTICIYSFLHTKDIHVVYTSVDFTLQFTQPFKSLKWLGWNVSFDLPNLKLYFINMFHVKCFYWIMKRKAANKSPEHHQKFC